MPCRTVQFQKTFSICSSKSKRLESICRCGESPIIDDFRGNIDNGKPMLEFKFKVDFEDEERSDIVRRIDRPSRRENGIGRDTQRYTP